MVFFITMLRTIAACLITNAHYTGIYPIEIVANGGLIGDILFFAVSGYCLCNIKTTFIKWYGKRLYRIYVPVIIITIIYGAIGAYSISLKSFFWWLVYPTYYHFVASIIVLYIPFYFCMINKFIRDHIPILMLIILGIYIFIYIYIYDSSYYHIDNVYEPMIRFLFFESMLFGAHYRIKIEKKTNINSNIILNLSLTLFFSLFYFVSKILFSRYKEITKYQIFNQIIIFVLLICIFKLFAEIHSWNFLPKWIKNIIIFISKLTLEIYVVQYVIIDFIKKYSFMFPINWIIVTAAILISAFLLNLCCKYIYLGIDKVGKAIKNNIFSETL